MCVSVCRYVYPHVDVYTYIGINVVILNSSKVIRLHKQLTIRYFKYHHIKTVFYLFIYLCFIHDSETQGFPKPFI